MKGDMCLSSVPWRQEGAKMDERAVGLCFVMKFSWAEYCQQKEM